MEQWPIQPMHDRHACPLGPNTHARVRTSSGGVSAVLVAFTAFKGATEAGRSAISVVGYAYDLVEFAVGAGLFDVSCSLDPELAAVFLLFSCRGRRSSASDFGNGENGFPSCEDPAAIRRRRIPETSARKGALSPAVVDAGEMPVDFVGGGVAVELVADVDEVLDGGDVDIVDGGKVEDDGFEGGFCGVVGGRAVAAGARVVPGAVLVSILVGLLTRFGEGRLTPNFG